MPVNALSRHIEEHDTRLWRIIRHYVSEAMNKLDLESVKHVGIDETARSRGHNYVTTFIDMDREDRPVIFCTQGKGQETVKEFKRFLETHKGTPRNIAQVVCDMSPAFLGSVDKEFPSAAVTVDWFHIVKHFTDAVDSVRGLEAKRERFPKGSRWALLKGDAARTENQKAALEDLFSRGLKTAKAFLIKEKLRWVRDADDQSSARWRMTNFLKFSHEQVGGDEPVLEPIREALRTLERHMGQVLERWKSYLTNARMEGMNGLFQAVRSRARGYRNAATFITMIYLIGAPISEILWP